MPGMRGRDEGKGIMAASVGATLWVSERPYTFPVYTLTVLRLE
jgi:hypothetical protein